MLSNECEPEMVIWLFGPASVTPGDSSVMALMFRFTGSSSIVSILKFVVTCVLSAVGAAAAGGGGVDRDLLANRLHPGEIERGGIIPRRQRGKVVPAGLAAHGGAASL